MEPGVIRKLSQSVVNRIAAGEIIQRPANALKELIENSLDAKSSTIQITLKSGGLKHLQIQDNGTGIRKDDLEIVCERFTTSKLTEFEDLASIATFGFRGEALASISHVAHLTIQTKTAQEICGYKACYKDSKLMAPPKPCAGNQGTIITIEDLFYNMPQRRQCLKSPYEEYQKIYDIVSKYAVHNYEVAFHLKKIGDTKCVRTNVNSTQEQNIGLIYGSQIANELLAIESQNDTLKFSLRGYITKVDYSAKKGIFLLFINHRLVESANLKTVIDSVYSAYLPRGMHPFVYLSLELDPNNIDVNVHPTKHEVHFLHEDQIIENVKGVIELRLLGSNSSRTFYKQIRLPGISDEQDEITKESKTELEKRDDKKMIRTDNKEQKLDKFLSQSQAPMVAKLEKADSGCSNLSSNDESYRAVAAKKTKEVRLTSVMNMRKNVERGCSASLRRILKEMCFVGVADRMFALFQHETKLYLGNTQRLSEELFYQRLVFGFQNFDKILIEPAVSIKELIRLALDIDESGWAEDDGPKDELAERAAEILVSKAALMSEYFAVNISDEGKLESLPVLLHQHLPCSTFLPLYLLRLASEVDWDEEEACFEIFCRETAAFYARSSASDYKDKPNAQNWSIEHVIYPAFKRYLLPPSKLKQSLYELTDLPSLYKVFERC